MKKPTSQSLDFGSNFWGSAHSEPLFYVFMVALNQLKILVFVNNVIFVKNIMHILNVNIFAILVSII